MKENVKELIEEFTSLSLEDQKDVMNAIKAHWDDIGVCDKCGNEKGARGVCWSCYESHCDLDPIE